MAHPGRLLAAGRCKWGVLGVAASIAVLIMISTAVLWACVGLGEFAANAALQFGVTGKPKPWVSIERIHRRRVQLKELLGPAVVAFLASGACNIGTSLLVNEFAGSSPRNLWPGLLWLVAGAVALVVALVALIALPTGEPWDLARTYEALLVTTHQKLRDPPRDFVDAARTRLAEIDASNERMLHRSASALAVLPLPPEAAGARARWAIGGFRDSRGGSYPVKWRQVLRWATARRQKTFHAWWTTMMLSMLIFLVLQPWNWGSSQGTTFVGVFLALGAISVPAALRLDLVYWARVGAENTGFRKTLTEELDRLEAQLLKAYAAEPRARTMLQIGPFRLSRGHDS